MQVKEICNQVKERLTDLKTNYRKNGVLMNQNDIDYLKKIVTRSGVKYHDLYYINASRYLLAFSYSIIRNLIKEICLNLSYN